MLRPQSAVWPSLLNVGSEKRGRSLGFCLGDFVSGVALGWCIPQVKHWRSSGNAEE